MEEQLRERYAQMSYKSLSLELEAIVRSLESDQLELESSLEEYEKGVYLLKLLKEKLSQAEQKVETLMGEIEPQLDDEVDQKLS